jgi:hypothetical protein
MCRFTIAMRKLAWLSHKLKGYPGLLSDLGIVSGPQAGHAVIADLLSYNHKLKGGFCAVLACPPE